MTPFRGLQNGLPRLGRYGGGALSRKFGMADFGPEKLGNKSGWWCNNHLEKY